MWGDYPGENDTIMRVYDSNLLILKNYIQKVIKMDLAFRRRILHEDNAFAHKAILTIDTNRDASLNQGALTTLDEYFRRNSKGTR